MKIASPVPQGRVGKRFPARPHSQQHPNDADVLRILGWGAYSQGQYERAIQLYQQSLALNSANPELHNNMAIALVETGKINEAIGHLQQALSLRPDYLEARNNLALLMSNLSPQQRDSITISPVPLTPEKTYDTNSQLQIALAHYQAGKLEDAERSYHQILQQEPYNVNVMQLLGQLYYRTGQLERASGYYRQALSLKPNSPQLLCIYGDTLTGQNKIDEAIGHFRQALALDPNYVYGHWGLAMALLLSGDLQQGFAEYEWRWQLSEVAQRPYYSLSVPLWDGKPLAGQTILLYEEQGLGDSIQFIRYAPLVKQQGGKVIVACSQALKRLFSTIPELDRLIVDGDPLPEINFRAPLMSLPHLLGTTMENIPAQVPYLYAKEEEAVKYSGSLQTSDKFKVGIVWASKLNDPTSGKRSCDLKHFLKLLLSLPGMTLYGWGRAGNRFPTLP